MLEYELVLVTGSPCHDKVVFLSSHEELFDYLQRSDVKELKVLYKSFIEKLRPQQNGSMWRR